MSKPKCEICAAVKSKLRPNACKKCGKTPKAGHFSIMVDWHVSCDCGERVGDFPTYDAAVTAWNKLHKKVLKVLKKTLKKRKKK